MKRFFVLFLCWCMAVMPVMGCAKRTTVQQVPQQEMTHQDYANMLRDRLPYPFFLDTGGGKGRTISAQNDTPMQSWQKLAEQLSPHPKQFSIWISPKLVEQAQYNKNVEAVFGEIGYGCDKQELVAQKYIPKSQQGKKNPKKKTTKLWKMDFTWKGGNVPPVQQMPMQGNPTQYQQSQQLQQPGQPVHYQQQPQSVHYQQQQPQQVTTTRSSINWGSVFGWVASVGATIGIYAIMRNAYD